MKMDEKKILLDFILNSFFNSSNHFYLYDHFFQ
jgi:hypothetical protein